MFDFDLTQYVTPEETAGLVWPVTNDLLLEAGMCLWEELLSVRSGLEQQPPTGMEDYWDNVGACQMRSDVGKLVPYLHVAWHLHINAAGDDVLVPFDWEFTPWFLSECIEWDAQMGPNVKADWAQMARAIRG